ncbi:MAG: hypothetical protein M1819_006635 [Sarea resinae]|nr:MAG: hypothetical protein M1819_006635 [Sarea resinae]
MRANKATKSKSKQTEDERTSSQKENMTEEDPREEKINNIDAPNRPNQTGLDQQRNLIPMDDKADKTPK